MGNAWAHKHGGTVSGSASLLSPPVSSLLCPANAQTLIVRTLCVTKAPTVILSDSGVRARLISVAQRIFDVLRPPRCFPDCWQMLGGTELIAVLQCALEIYTRGCGVHRCPACDYRDELVSGPEPFLVSDLSPYVMWIYRWCNQRPFYRSCYIAHDSSLISHHGTANVGQRITQIFYFACVEIVFSEFFLF